MHCKRYLLQYTKLIFLVSLVLLLLFQTSCKKYLDKKPKEDLTVPSTLNDLQAVLDNETTNGDSPGDLEFVTDNYYLTTESWNNLSTMTQKLSYVWDKNAQVTTADVWDQPYNAIYEANFVLDELPKMLVSESEKNIYNNIKGTALFYRSFIFHQLAQLFCKPYSTSASTDLGIILRLTSNVNIPSSRSTVQQTYDQIITDLKTAALLLPAKSLFITRPNNAAAYGELARVYLSMRDYINAGRYADSCLNIYNSLLDYKSLNLSPAPGSSPFPYLATNPEILYLSYEGFAPNGIRDSHKQLIDSLLYQSYDINDLRKTLFFGSNTGTGTFYWQGCYYNNSSPSYIFDGIATDEIYLIRAECSARAGNANRAMDDLTTLLRNRWKDGTYTDTTATDATDALNRVLRERRKELLFRGLRWSDLRRFNLEGNNITLIRIINGVPYMLPPNDLRWVILIPDKEITRSGIQQNPR